MKFKEYINEKDEKKDIIKQVMTLRDGEEKVINSHTVKRLNFNVIKVDGIKMRNGEAARTVSVKN